MPTPNVGVGVTSTTGQTIASGVVTQIAFDAAIYDTNAMFDNPSDTLVVNTPGRYLLKSRLEWNIFVPIPNQNRQLRIRVNGNNVALDLQDTLITSQFGLISQEASVIVPLNVGDRISLAVFQNTGNNALSVGAPPLAPQLQAEWLAP
ncbi:hypothetical protein ACFWDI_01020 [Streptomyces sp. NPDC060064]|uniref:hypothetical protein n=1 Tax=Streptomyces sp. NPDC060064 TaxID=3347049 RepID=UPI003674760F